MIPGRCRCGCPGDPIDLGFPAGVATVYVCRPCFDLFLAELARNREKFQALLDAGLSRAEANDRMIAEMEESPKGIA